MSAVAETSVAEYRMPKPARGQQVLWYPHADQNEEPQVAFILQVGTRTVMVQVAGVPLDTVRHIDDPKLRVNEEQRENGAWQFPDTERDVALLKEDVSLLKERVITLERQVKALQELLEEPAKKPGK